MAKNESPEEVRREHLSSEKAVRDAGVVAYILCGVFAAAATLSLFSLIKDEQAGAGVVLFSLCGLFAAGYFFVARGLRRLESWSRVPAFLLGLIIVLAFPIGTILGGYLVYLAWYKPKRFVYSTTYKEIMASTHQLPLKKKAA